jgi:hypothetical protein
MNFTVDCSVTQEMLCGAAGAHEGCLNLMPCPTAMLDESSVTKVAFFSGLFLDTDDPANYHSYKLRV